LKVGIAGLEGRDLLGAHGLVLIKLSEALDDTHHLIHAGLGTSLGGGVAHQVLQTEGKSLNEGHIFVLNALPAVSPPSEEVLRVLVDGGAESDAGRPSEQNHDGVTRSATPLKVRQDTGGWSGRAKY